MKIFYILYFSFLLIPFSFSQAPGIEWQNTIGGSGSDQLTSIEVTSDGGYIIAGYSNSYISGDKTENGYGSNDYWVIKLDSVGEIEWQKTIGGSEQDGGGNFYEDVVIRVCSDGSYILGGTSNSVVSGLKTEASFLGTPDYWVIKLTIAGEIEWQNTIGGAGYDYLTCINQTTDGGYIIGGSSDSPISGDKLESSMGLFDYWIIKLDSEGIIEWQNTIGGNATDYFMDINQTSDEGYILAGNSWSGISGDKTESDGDLYGDYWIIKLDEVGNIVWQNTIGGDSDDFPECIEQTGDGGYIVAGVSSSDISEDKTENHLGPVWYYGDYWILKLDEDGNIVWQNTIGGFSDEFLKSLVQTSDGGFILGGYSNSGISGDKSEPSEGAVDFWIVRLNSSGNILWENTIGGWNTDILRCINQRSDGKFIVGGYSNSPISGDKSENTIGIYGYTDYWILTLSHECTFYTYYADDDLDGYGNILKTISLCDDIPPIGYVIDYTDCNDSVNTIHSFASEICNELDDNCNLIIDEDLPLNTYYFDEDADGFGVSDSLIIVCFEIPPPGYVIDSTDCDDTNDLIHESILYYADIDGDLFGDELNSELFCDIFIPDGYVTNNLDCDDSNILINPVTNEICNNIDDNCNTEIDEGLSIQTLYIDADGDNFGNPLIDTITCLLGITGYLSDSTDCDDTNPDIFPGAEEILNGVDDNCNKLIDEGVGIEDFENSNFIIYPNPSTDKITINLSSTILTTHHSPLTITDLSGKKIAEYQLTSSSTEIDISNYASGIYFVKVMVNDEIFLQKLIKQ